MEGKEAILCALAEYIKNEQDGFYFYEYSAKRTSDERGQQMFRSLAADELRHIAGLQAEYEAVLNDQAWVAVQQFGACKLPDKDTIFPANKARVDEMIREAATDLDALRIAIEMEKASYETYKAEADKAKSPEVRQVFEALANEEHGHFEILDNTFNYLANTGDWYQVAEKPIFEGG